MDKDLYNAYSSTLYQVAEPRVDIRIGVKSKELDALLLLHNRTTYAFITAWNPFSKILSEDENNRRNKLLFEELFKKYVLFQGHGIGQDPKWKPEESFLVLGIDERTAAELGRKYEQNAIVFGAYDEEPQLLVLVKM
jgi:hypothetical protein